MCSVDFDHPKQQQPFLKLDIAVYNVKYLIYNLTFMLYQKLNRIYCTCEISETYLKLNQAVSSCMTLHLCVCNLGGCDYLNDR